MTSIKALGDEAHCEGGQVTRNLANAKAVKLIPCEGDFRVFGASGFATASLACGAPALKWFVTGHG